LSSSCTWSLMDDDGLEASPILIACMVPRLSLSSNRNRTVWSEYLTSFFVCVCDELASIRTHIRLVYNVLILISNHKFMIDIPLVYIWLSTYTKDTSLKKMIWRYRKRISRVIVWQPLLYHWMHIYRRQRIRNVHTRQLSTWAVVRVKANIQSNVSNVLRIFIKCSSGCNQTISLP
jgi:hypothetical protein